MRYKIENMARRPVSVVCNSGKAFHFPPRYASEFAEVEVKDNAMINKLVDKKILSMQKMEQKKTAKESASAQDKDNKTAKPKK